MLTLVIVYVGCLLQAIAVTTILKPNNLVVGGFTGLSLVFERFTGFRYTWIYYGICLLILILAYFILGKKEVLKIVLLSMTYPIILMLVDSIVSGFNLIGYGTPDKLLSCIYYGIICGIGVGLVMKSGYSQGSSDTVAKIIHRKIFPFISISQILLGLDMCILGLSTFVFERSAIMYAILMHFVYSKTIETILYGLGSTKVRVEIVSRFNDVISQFIMDELGCGVSLIPVKGGYSKSLSEKLMIVCTKRESMILKTFVGNVDSKAFMHILPVVSVWGGNDAFDSLVEEQ